MELEPELSELDLMKVKSDNSGFFCFPGALQGMLWQQHKLSTWNRVQVPASRSL